MNRYILESGAGPRRVLPFRRYVHARVDVRSVARAVLCAALLLGGALAQAQDTNRPVLLGKQWMAVTGKPQGAAAGAMTFQRGGNAVDAAAAMLAATATMWDARDPDAEPRHA